MVLFVAVRGVCALLINHKVSEGPPELQSLAKKSGLVASAGDQYGRFYFNRDSI
jgi:hypothetical protein